MSGDNPYSGFSGYGAPQVNAGGGEVPANAAPVLIKDTTTQSFTQEVIAESRKQPVLVDFWAPWCGPCKMIAPILDKFAKEYEGKLLITKINTDENQEWMTKYGIQGIPTMLFVANGKVVHRQVGALPERMLRDTLTQFIESVSQS